MSFYDQIKYHTGSVKETLAESPQPVIKIKTLCPMHPKGLYGSVYEDPRGMNILRITIIAGVLCGLIVIILAGGYLNERIQEANAIPASVQALSDQSDLNVPALSTFIASDDQTIYDTLSATYTIYQSSWDDNGMDLTKLSTGLTTEQFANDQATGLLNLDIDEIAKILKGSWFFSSSRGTSTMIKVKYADFTSKTTDKAIANAVATQGFSGDGVSVLSSGVDDNGNTYEYGSIIINNVTYYWRVAAIDIHDVYFYSKLPSNGFYVGVTLSATTLMDLTASSADSTKLL